MNKILLLVRVSDYEDEDTEIIKAFPTRGLLMSYMKKEGLHYKKNNEEQGYDWEEVEFINSITV